MRLDLNPIKLSSLHEDVINIELISSRIDVAYFSILLYYAVAHAFFKVFKLNKPISFFSTPSPVRGTSVTKKFEFVELYGENTVS
jgi:hypothetical protein